MSGKLELEQAMGLTPGQRLNLSSAGISPLIMSGKLELEQAMGLTPGQRLNLSPMAIKDLIINGKLELEQAMNLSEEERNSLDFPIIISLIKDGVIDIHDAFRLIPEERIIYEYIGYLIQLRYISPDRFINSNEQQKQLCTAYAVHNACQIGLILNEAAKDLIENRITNETARNMYRLLEDSSIELEYAINLSEAAIEDLIRHPPQRQINQYVNENTIEFLESKDSKFIINGKEITETDIEKLREAYIDLNGYQFKDGSGSLLLLTDVIQAINFVSKRGILDYGPEAGVYRGFDLKSKPEKAPQGEYHINNVMEAQQFVQNTIKSKEFRDIVEELIDNTDHESPEIKQAGQSLKSILLLNRAELRAKPILEHLKKLRNQEAVVKIGTDNGGRLSVTKPFRPR